MASVSKILRASKLQLHFNLSLRAFSAPSEHTLMHRFYQHVSQHAMNQETESSLSNNLRTRDASIIFENLDRVYKTSKNVVTTPVYRKAMEQFRIVVNEDRVEKNDLVKLIFYVGLQKKTKQSQTMTNLALNRLQKNLSSLNLTDTCIVANTVFKCGVPKVKTQLVNFISKKCVENLQCLLDNPAELCCFVKVLRQQRFHNFELLQELVRNSEKWCDSYMTRAHVLSYFADAKFAPEELNKVIEFSIKNLHIGAREKDIVRIFWVASILSFELPSNTVPEVWKVISGKFQDSTTYPDLLLDCLLSMAVMGHYNEDLTTIVLTPKSIGYFKELDMRMPWMRLYQLLDFRKIECGLQSTYPGPPFTHPPLQQQMESRPWLKRIFNFVKFLESKLELTQTSCCFNISSINIAGIKTSKNDRELCIEVMDPFVCLSKSSHPAGYMKLKIRLLQKMNANCLIIDPERQNIAEEDLYAWIEDEIGRLLGI